MGFWQIIKDLKIAFDWQGSSNLLQISLQFLEITNFT